MKTNANCTVYNKFTNPTTKRDEYKRTELYGVFWENTKGANIIRSGLTNADSATVRIPFSVTCSKAHVDPKAYKPENALTQWTIKPGDKLVKGIVTYEIPQGTVAELEKTFDDVVTVTTVDKNDYGSYPLRHFRVGGV